MIKALAETPNEDLYSTEIVESITSHVYKTYYWQIILKVCLPYFLYFLATNFYMSNYLVVDVGTLESGEGKMQEFVLRQSENQKR